MFVASVRRSGPRSIPRQQYSRLLAGDRPPRRDTGAALAQLLVLLGVHGYARPPRRPPGARTPAARWWRVVARVRGGPDRSSYSPSAAAVDAAARDRALPRRRVRRRGAAARVRAAALGARGGRARTRRDAIPAELRLPRASQVCARRPTEPAHAASPPRLGGRSGSSASATRAARCSTCSSARSSPAAAASRRWLWTIAGDRTRFRSGKRAADAIPKDFATARRARRVGRRRPRAARRVASARGRLDALADEPAPPPQPTARRRSTAAPASIRAAAARQLFPLVEQLPEQLREIATSAPDFGADARRDARRAAGARHAARGGRSAVRRTR